MFLKKIYCGEFVILWKIMAFQHQQRIFLGEKEDLILSDFDFL
jgi:hypothetical protein